MQNSLSLKQSKGSNTKVSHSGPCGCHKTLPTERYRFNCFSSYQNLNLGTTFSKHQVVRDKLFSSSTQEFSTALYWRLFLLLSSLCCDGHTSGAGNLDRGENNFCTLCNPEEWGMSIAGGSDIKQMAVNKLRLPTENQWTTWLSNNREIKTHTNSNFSSIWKMLRGK